MPAASRMRCPVTGRTLSAQLGDRGNLIIGHPFLRKLDQPMDHFVAPGEGGDRIDPHFDIEVGHRPAAP